MGMKTEDEVRDIVDVDFVDVTEAVEREKAENANKKPMGFEVPEPKPEPAAPTNEPEPEQGAPAPDAASETPPTAGQDGLFGNKPGF